VERLEQGDLSLEESLAAFERGVTLIAPVIRLKERTKGGDLAQKAGEPAVEEFASDEPEAS